MSHEEFNKRIPKSIKILLFMHLLSTRDFARYTALVIEHYQEEMDRNNEKGATPQGEKK